MISAAVSGTPWLVPGIAASLLLALLLCKKLGRYVGLWNVAAFLYIVSLGMVASITITPSLSEFTSSFCSLEFPSPVSPGELAGTNQRSLNVLLFVPLGLASALTRRRRGLLVGASSLSLPFIIEFIQYAIPSFGRTCQGVDIVDNLTGLACGALLGVIVRVATRPGLHS
ncbi:VanZ family protein [Streptomyces sudanensis]|uniref:VanZ family protein n=1 Tax=Streptomyces sudanensis TaxID=436397 RepID=UPI0020CCCB85|nr:VanZ family protein [Streptomyces sudanensis]MCP9958736.1 VanZ family protein [Streptomyces sudanensis]MCQ0000771.1 VanZ family protein [Streptomyces sudanensis]